MPTTKGLAAKGLPVTSPLLSVASPVPLSAIQNANSATATPRHLEKLVAASPDPIQQHFHQNGLSGQEEQRHQNER